MKNRLSWRFAIGIWSLLIGASTAVADASLHLPALSDYPAEAEQMTQQNLPLLLAVVASDCSYCTQAKEDFLKPMARNPRYASLVVIRQLVRDDGGSLRNAAGEPESTAAFASRYGVKVTPTVLFLDAQGRELAERIVGISSVDYYGSFLDGAIDQSLSKLGNEARVP